MFIYMWLILFVIIFLIVVLMHDHIITFIYNHFGQSNSISESDNKDKDTKNSLDQWYYSTINNYSKLLKDLPYQYPSKIPEINVKDLNQEKFIELTKNFTEPLIIRGFLQDTTAVKKWDLEYLSSKYGRVKLPVIADGSVTKHQEYVKRHQAEYKSMTLAQHIEKIKRKEPLYLNNVSRIFGVYPQLLDDMQLENIEKYTGIDVKNNDNVTHMFLGGKDTGSSLHCSITGNFFYNIKGQKRWILIHPKFSAYLLPNISRTGLFVVSHFDILNAKKGDLVLNLPRYDFVLESGDLFFNPPWWWHAVQNLSNYTIGCANRYSDFYVGIKNNPLYSFIFFSHPLSNWKDFNFSSKRENNLKFDQALLRDILRKKDKVV